MLCYCGVVLADGWLFQRKEGQRLEQLLHDRQETSGATNRVSTPASSNNLPTVAAGGLIGHMEIPRLGLSVIVAEGMDTLTLQRAAGHIPGTAMPGEPGNVGIAGHRDTFFRPLRNVRKGDIITFATPAGDYRYRVVSTKIVSPSDVKVLDPSASEILTLVTCYPFYYVGPAPNRFIVRAERVVWVESRMAPAKEKPFETDVLAKETHFRRLARIDREFVGKVQDFDSAQRVLQLRRVRTIITWLDELG
jgi:sortase A